MMIQSLSANPVGRSPMAAAAVHAPSTFAPQSPRDSVSLGGATTAPAAEAAPAVPPLPAAYPVNGDKDAQLAWFRAQATGIPGQSGSENVAKLALALGGEVGIEVMPPADSLVESCIRYSRPGHEILPALQEAARHGVASSMEELVDIAESMVSVMGFRQDRPMETAYAAIRLQFALASSMGEVRPVLQGQGVSGEGFLLAPLRNLRPDAQSMAVAQCSLMAVKNGFDRMRDVARKFDQQGGLSPAPQPAIEHQEEYIVIGGVKVAIRKS